MTRRCSNCKGLFQGGSTEKDRIHPQGAVTVLGIEFVCDECVKLLLINDDLDK